MFDFERFHVFWILSEKVDSYVRKDFQNFVYIVNISLIYTNIMTFREMPRFVPYVPPE